MKRKRTIGLSIIILLSFLLLHAAGCSLGSELDQLSRQLGINTDHAVIAESWDEHDNFLGDGTTFKKICFSDNSCVDDMKRSRSWKPFPLTDNLTALVYGLDKEEVYIGGPVLHDNDNFDTPLVPQIENGYYYFIDRHSEAKDPSDDSDVLTRNSYNFTLALYDTDSDTLYYIRFDT